MPVAIRGKLSIQPLSRHKSSSCRRKRQSDVPFHFGCCPWHSHPRVIFFSQCRPIFPEVPTASTITLLLSYISDKEKVDRLADSAIALVISWFRTSADGRQFFELERKNPEKKFQASQTSSAGRLPTAQLAFLFRCAVACALGVSRLLQVEGSPKCC